MQTGDISKGLELDDEERVSGEAGSVPTGPPPTSGLRFISYGRFQGLFFEVMIKMSFKSPGKRTFTGKNP